MSKRKIHGYTLEEALEELAVWKEAKRKAATGKSYQISGRSLTRYDLHEINEQIKFYSRIVDILQNNPTGPIFAIARMRR